MKDRKMLLHLLAGIFFIITIPTISQVPALPSNEELVRPFGSQDSKTFKSPPNVYHPETWFHYIGGNVSLAGITADLEAISGAGISGVQLFHGQFGGPWPGVEPQIACLSPLWDDAVRHTAEECRRLGLRFTMQNCPGWAMSGGPWIEPSNAMRNLVWSRTDIDGGTAVDEILPVPQPSNEPWRDYKDITVLAFPTPLDDTGQPLKPSSVKSNREMAWKDCLLGTATEPLLFAPTTAADPHWIEVTFPKAVTVRTVEFPSINSLNHSWCYEPGVDVTVQAFLPDGKTETILQTALPQSSWQDDYPISIACPEVKGVKKYRISIVNRHDIALRSLRLFAAARKNNWESEAGWTLRSIERTGAHPRQSAEAFIRPDKILDLSGSMDEKGNLKWKAPAGKWTILRVGHVNAGMKNAPAPAEGTGWECDKLSEAGPNAHFAGYIGRLSNGPLKGGLLNGMLLDSWECKTQTWTTQMEPEFQRVTGYSLRKWLPAVFGYVIGNQETTARFLLDWRSTLGDLFANKFYERMSKLAKDNGLSVSYETAAGDIFPADIMEYYKYADIPMCEFWQPFSEGFVGSLNFKPIKPTASAARLYGKPRVAAEAFTSFSLTWDEHWDMLKEVANINSVEGVTHLVFHTYTHNPRTDFLPPGTSFGSGIGTPFLRGQTWWKHMPEFTTYLSRCTYLLERGRPVSDVLWYLGDEMNHKPDQNAPFPEGFKYDYCNPDVLLNRLSVLDGQLVTPEGTAYRILWIPDAPRMLPETLEKLQILIREGATVVADAPQGLATLTGGKEAQKRFDDAVKTLWGKVSGKSVRKIGKGKILSGMALPEALRELHLSPDVKGEALWVHRKAEGADWYFVCAPKGQEFKGTLDFRCHGQVELWDPVTGECIPKAGKHNGDYTSVELDLPRAGSCFIVFRPGEESRVPGEGTPALTSRTLDNPWTLSFPSGWGAPAELRIKDLQAWKELDLSPEGKAFSGTVTYTTTFNLDEVMPAMHYFLDLGRVEMIAVVSLNGKPLRTLWAPPYNLDLTDAVKPGENTLTVEVTSTWFNRLVYDAGQPEANRKTWTINGPDKKEPLRNSGLLGPVVLKTESSVQK
ncbi:glycosyl hydrolase [Parabacteroides sp. Marseille-P3160]|uniref:glycosyl hydrolase n=1 Tax=Parabacteroides sp. Marseille-P3160 TaxID=1917887 RepID=UPI001F21711F|nr:glycosyl hydrolase [Parabacteroides sp. Marseille-P3160]